MTNAQTLTHQLLMRKFLNHLDLMLLEMIAEQKFQRQRDLIQLMRLINLMSLHLQGPMLQEMMIADPMCQSLQDLMVNKMINLKSHLPPDPMLLETKADPIFLHLQDPMLQMRQINLMSLHLQGPMLQEMMIADPMCQSLQDLTVNKIINLKSHLPPDLMLLETKADPIFLNLPDLMLQMRQIKLMSLHLQGPMLQVMMLDLMFQRLRDLMPLMRQMFHHQRLDQVMTLNLAHQPHLL